MTTNCEDCELEYDGQHCPFCKRLHDEFNSQHKARFDKQINHIKAQLASNRLSKAGYLERHQHASELEAMT